MVWTSELFSTNGTRLTSLGEAVDGSVLFLKEEDSTIPNILMIDATTGLTIWQKNINDILPSDREAFTPLNLSGVPTLDGGITIGLKTNSIAIDLNRQFFLAKLNQNCEVEWEQEYGSSYQNYTLQLASSDGGYILTQSNASQEYDFLKLNSVGLESPFCATGLPDLFVQNLNVFDNNGAPYMPTDYIGFTWEYGNAGIIGPGNYSLGIYLGDNDVYEADDILLGELTFNSLTDVLEFNAFELPIPDVPSGIYRIHLFIDNLEEVVEITEGNNIATSSTFEILNQNTSSCPDELPGFISLGEFGGSKYFLSEEVAKPTDAIATAIQNGGHLAAIGSQAENDFLANLIPEMVYLGLNDFDVEEEIVWEDGNPITFTNFDICDFCNDNSPNMDFVVMHNWNGGWSWSNFYNSRKYVVEIACPIMLTDPTNNTLIAILSENEAAERIVHLEKVFPNPAEEVIFTQIKSTVKETIDLMIYDTRGVLVKSRKVNLTLGENKIQINVNDLSKGVYSIFIPKADEGFTTLRFIK